MEEPKSNDLNSLNQNGGQPTYPVYNPTTHIMNQLYDRNAMIHMTHGHGIDNTHNPMAEVGQASINHVYGHDASKGHNASMGQVYGQAPPAYVEKDGGVQPAPAPSAPGQSTGGSTFISLPEIIVNDETDDVFKTYDFSDTTIRRGFIRKVFSLVLLQLSVTAAIVSAIRFHEGTRMFMLQNGQIILYVAGATYFTTAICIHCCEGPRRRVPYNYIFLLMFTSALSLLLGIATVFTDGIEILIAFGITMAIVIALTIFAFQTKYDFTMLGGFLLSFFLCLILVGFLAIFTYSEPLNLLYCGIGILFFSFLLVYDIQLIIGGQHRYTISPEDYVFAALCIYLDIINIFIRVLRLVR